MLALVGRGIRGSRCTELDQSGEGAGIRPLGLTSRDPSPPLLPKAFTVPFLLVHIQTREDG